MIVTPIDPVCGNTVTDPEQHPFVAEGRCLHALTILREYEGSGRINLTAQVDNPGPHNESEQPLHS